MWTDNRTVRDVYESLTAEQQFVVHYLVAQLLKEGK